MGKLDKNYELVRKAMAFAISAHEGQFRDGSGLPYVTHPISVYSTVKKYKESKNIISILCASILHDVIEDCKVTYEQLETLFGKMTADLVLELTNDEVEKTKLGKEEYINRKLLSLSSYALIIKLADMLDNLSDRPSEGMLKRIKNNLLHLVSNRELSRTHQKILQEINNIFMDYDVSPVVVI